MKVAIIAIAKNEELYINEWINYHLNLGFDNIIICDNDDELILPSVINNDRVIIEDYTKIEAVQPKAYTDMFIKYRKDFDWFLFIDVDEFLFLEKHRNVKDFISEFQDNVDVIRLNWKHYTDSERLDVIDGDYKVLGRFPTSIHTDLDFYTKPFMRTKINVEDKDIHIRAHGFYFDGLNAVDAIGHKCNSIYERIKNVIYENAWINHYRTKTIGEYIRQKYFRGSCNGVSGRYREWKEYFFKTNIVRDEKIKYAEELIEKISREKKQ